NITGGQLDSTWTTTDYTTCETVFDTALTAYKPYMPSYWSVSQYRWYAMRFSELPTSPIIPPNRDKPFQETGPPQRLTSKSIAGTGGLETPPQIACSVTEKTDWAHHWGRAYLPFACTASTMASNGRLSSASATAVANVASSIHTGLASADFQIVVPVTQFDKDPVRTFLQVRSVQVDDLVDIQRRRRYRNPTLRIIKP